MILNKFLNESVYDINDSMIVEASNEGFTFEDGGMARAISLAETEMTKLEMADMVTEAKAVQLIVKGRMNNLSESAIMEEVNMLQENVLTNTWEKIKQIAMKLWARIKAIIESALTWITKTFNKSAFIKTARKQLEKYTDFEDLDFEGYEYDYKAVEADKAFAIASKCIEDKFKELDSKHNINSKSSKEDIAAAKDALEEIKSESFKDEIAGSIIDGASYTDFKSKVVEKMKGDKKSLTFDKNAALTRIDNEGKIKTQINAIKTKVDNAFRQAIAEMGKEEKEAKKIKDKANTDEQPFATFAYQTLVASSSLLNVALTLSSEVSDAALTIIKEETKQTLNFVSAALSKGRKNHVKASNESTDLGGSFLDSILAEI